MEINKFVEFRKKVNENISKVIVGKEKQIDKIIVAFICSGHVLLEDVPGLGKTKLARSLAKTINCSFSRIQFTPDLLPSDLTGIYYYNQKEQDFVYKKGPIMSQIVLADEINRATPRTQSALLECMEERQVTVEGNTKKLDKPFFVIATQNPVEQFGTFPLPEAQLDRFFMKLSMGYPTIEEELEMLNRFNQNDPIDDLQSVVTLEEIKYVQENYNKIHISEDILRYIVEIVDATRNNESLLLGGSPRSTLALMKAGQAMAAINGRDYVIPEDVKGVTADILSHRVMAKNHLSMNKEAARKIVNEIINV